MRLITFAAIAAQMMVAATAFAAPTRPLADVQGTALPQSQWFTTTSPTQPTPHSINNQFYDNPAWEDINGPGWGGDPDTMAIYGYVGGYNSVNGNISEFTVVARITNDSYDYPYSLTGTAATYGTFQAPDMLYQQAEPLFNAHISANFAGKDGGGSSNIYAVGYDDLAFYGTSTAEPPVDGANGQYCVPTWLLGDIAPGATVTKTMTFKLQSNVAPGSTMYNWITSSFENQTDIFASRTRTTKIPMYPTGLLTDDASAWPSFAATNSCNVSVFYEQRPFLIMSRGESVPYEHYWWNGMSRGPGEMLQLKALAGPTMDADLKSITVQGFGTGQDKNDISSISVYYDEDGNGQIDTGEVLLGSGTYSADNGTCTINFASPVTVPASNVAYLIVAYTLSNAVSPGKTFQFDVISANAVRTETTVAVPVFGLPIASCTKVVSALPQTVLSIGEAKKLPLGSLVMLQAKPVIGDVGDNTYIEEPTCTSGIALAASTDAWRHPWFGANEFVTVIGKTAVQERDGQAIIKDPMFVSAIGFALPAPVMTTCKSVGGGAFGIQRGTMDRVGFGEEPGKQSGGLNNVGMLVKVFGKVTNVSWDTLWIDDGSQLWDGWFDDLGGPLTGLRVLMSADMIYDSTLVPAPNDYIEVTGIVTTVPYAESVEVPQPLLKAVGVRDASGVRVLKSAEPGL